MKQKKTRKTKSEILTTTYTTISRLLIRILKLWNYEVLYFMQIKYRVINP